MRLQVIAMTIARSISAIVLAAALSAANVSANTMFTEDFSDQTCGSNMMLGPAAGSPSVSYSNYDFTITGQGSRIYLGTNDTDYAKADFDFWATTIVPDTGRSGSSPFFGMGSTTPDGAYWDEPGSPRLTVMIQAGTGYYVTADDYVNAATAVSGSVAATYRLHMHWNATTKQASFEIDKDYNGTFSADYTTTLDGSNNAFTTSNAKLLIGGGDGVSFDNVVVTQTPEPGTIALLVNGLLGLLAYAWRKRRCVPSQS
jgi:hypothetical protein